MYVQELLMHSASIVFSLWSSSSSCESTVSCVQSVQICTYIVDVHFCARNSCQINHSLHNYLFTFTPPLLYPSPSGKPFTLLPLDETSKYSTA